MYFIDFFFCTRYKNKDIRDLKGDRLMWSREIKRLSFIFFKLMIKFPSPANRGLLVIQVDPMFCLREQKPHGFRSLIMSFKYLQIVVHKN